MTTDETDPTRDQTTSRQRVLIVEDDPMVQMMVQKAVEGDGRAVRVTETVEEARSALSEEDYDSVILDLFLPDGDGRQLLAEIRERPRSAQVQVLVLSGATGKNTKLECFRLGADEFLEKPADPELLQAAVDRQLQRARTRATASRVDPLTGLPNRAALVEAFTELLGVSERSDAPLTVALLEMKGLERLRSQHGRETADDLQAAFAEVLSEAVEEPDVVGRWEDATFVALLPGTSPQEAESPLSRALDEVRFHPFARPGAEENEGDAGDAEGEGDAGNARDAGDEKDAANEADERDEKDAASDEAPDDLSLTFSAGVVDGRRFEELKEAARQAEQAMGYAPSREGGGTIVVHPDDTEAEIDKTVRVLLVEDDDVLAELVKHRLEREGLEVTRLATGSEARDHMEEASPDEHDVVLCDVKLPGVDGFELLQGFKGRPGWSEIPVVMVTSMGRESDVVRAFELGADDYVLKPISPAELIARIHRLLRED